MDRITIPKSIHAMMAKLSEIGEVRIVGGAIRDEMLGSYKDDCQYDLAIKTHPEKLVVRAKQEKNWHLVLDGLEHGVVRIIEKGVMVEVACLRRDIKTDGRHAEVIFDGDWGDDAKRRDFTINSLYADMAGDIIDELGAMKDFSPLTLKFIGTARTRIREDYLRIFRYYRFWATLPNIKINPEDEAVIKEESEGITQISLERIGIELYKIFASDRANEILPKMEYLLRLLNFNTEKLGEISSVVFDKAKGRSQEQRIAFYYYLTIGHINKKLAMPKNITHIIEKLWSAIDKNLSAFAIHYRYGSDVYQVWLLTEFLFGRDGQPDSHAKMSEGQYDNLYAIATRPIFPITGKDLQDIGFDQNDFSQYFSMLEELWIKKEGNINKTDLIAEAKKLKK